MEEAAVCAAIADLLDLPPGRIGPESKLRELVTDSFALVETVIDLQDRFQVTFTQTDFRTVTTVRDLALLFSRQTPPAVPG